MTYFETTPEGLLPAGTDIAAVLREGDERALHAAWNTYHRIRFTHDALAELAAGKIKPDTTIDVPAYLRAQIAELAPVTALQALEANRRLVEFLTARRWSVMQAAREADASWSAIGTALDMTKQGALDWYKRKIDLHAKYMPDLHDAERARAALTD
ncbi:hypothetical protein ACWDOP_00230 [Nocardia sp. NPDC003693]